MRQTHTREAISPQRTLGMGANVIREGQEGSEHSQRQQNDDDRLGSLIRVRHAAVNLN